MPDSSVITAASPKEDLDRLSQDNYHKLEQRRNKLEQNVQSTLDQQIPHDIPQPTRSQIIKETGSTIVDQTIREISRQPNLSDAEFDIAKKQAFKKSVSYTADRMSTFYNLTNPKSRRQIAEDLDQNFSKEDAQQIAQASHQLNQINQERGLSSQDVTNEIFKDEPNETIYGLNQDEVKSIIEETRQKVTSDQKVTDTPSSYHLHLATEDALEQTVREKVASEDAANKLIDKIKSQQPLLERLAKQDIEPLPQTGPFNPYQPKLKTKTHRQAQRLGVNPLALEYVKAGFSADDKRLSASLKKEVAHINGLFADPFAKDSQLGLFGQIAAARLAPRVFLAQHYLFPIYDAHQQALTTANKYLETPFGFYKTVNEKYGQLQKDYLKFKKENTAGWLLAPGMRFNMAWDKTKKNTKLRINEFIKKRPKLDRVRNNFSAFWGQWSPKGIKKQATGWIIKTTAQATWKFGNAIGSKFLMNVGTQALKGTSALAVPLAFLQISFGIAKGFFSKLKGQIANQKFAQDAAGAGAKALQVLFGGLKAIGAVVGGSIGGLAGSILGAVIGFSIGGPIGAVVGFFGGGAIGSALFALIGYNWMTIAAIPASILGFTTTMTGTGAATIANTAGLVGVGGSLAVPAFEYMQTTTTVGSGFFVATPSAVVDPQQNQIEVTSLQKITSLLPLKIGDLTIEEIRYENNTLTITLNSLTPGNKQITLDWLQEQGITLLDEILLNWIEK